MSRRCRTCGQAEMTSRAETYRYVESGLPNVVLESVEVRRCRSCGHHELVLPRVAELHQTIARAVLTKTTRLSGAEIRYLRKSLGWSGVDFARHMGVDPSTVSKWETDKEPIGATSDRLLRLMVAYGTPVEDYSLDDLRTIVAESRPATDVRLAPHSDGWRLAQGGVQ